MANQQTQWADVAHLYKPGYRVQNVEFLEIEGDVVGGKWFEFESEKAIYVQKGPIAFYPTEFWKPYLRRLDSLTEEELRTLFKTDEQACVEIKVDEAAFKTLMWFKTPFWEGKDSVNHTYQISADGLSARGFAYLLSLHIDLFGLIDSGQALDAATLGKEGQNG